MSDEEYRNREALVNLCGQYAGFEKSIAEMQEAQAARKKRILELLGGGTFKSPVYGTFTTVYKNETIIPPDLMAECRRLRNAATIAAKPHEDALTALMEAAAQDGRITVRRLEETTLRFTPIKRG